MLRKRAAACVCEVSRVAHARQTRLGWRQPLYAGDGQRSVAIEPGAAVRGEIVKVRISIGVTRASQPSRECYLRTRRLKWVCQFFLSLLDFIIRKGSRE